MTEQQKVKNEDYVHNDVESYWSQKWQEDELYRSKVDWSKPKYYALTMLPYPSGDLHIGHWFAMTPSDARARYLRMKGYNVMFPMGFDAFGLPAEHAAISRNIHPWKWTFSNIERMRSQLRNMGMMFDWEREAISAAPEYYKWTEWFFKKFYEHGLAYRGEALVNWSEALQTVLANEQVIDGKDERTGQPVVQKLMTQWFFKITNYADELLDFSKLDWPEPIKMMQTNWIGRSEGAKVTFYTADEDSIEIFTTRPDTLWGATFMVLAPEHSLVDQITTEDQQQAIADYKAQASRSTEIERMSDEREKTGVFTGAYAVNPVNGERIPIWIADYVMISYGTGAIMAVPAHDQRDFDFARKYGLGIRPVIQPDGDELDGATMTEAQPHDGVMINSGPFNGTHSNNEKGRKNPGINAVIDWLEEHGIGEEAINYRLRDWLISRQRYWGAPIPVIYNADGEIELVPDEDLPVLLPDDVEFMPTGRSPLTYHEPFLNTVDRQGRPAKRETDTMDTFMCSSWYQLRYLSPDYDKVPFDPEEAAYWLPVDAYTGGAEHATMHLMYTRFFTKVLRDIGIFDETIEVMKQHGRNPDEMFDEPMLLLRNQGQVLGAERVGDTILATGKFEDEVLIADYVEVIDRNDSRTPENGVGGEVMRRTENILQVAVNGQLQTVEVLPDAEVIIPHIDGEGRVDQLKHHLEIQRMSKSKGNVVNPDELVTAYGGDSVRAYLMFAFDFEKGGPWDPQGIQGVIRWLNDIWDIVVAGPPTQNGTPDAERDILRKAHQAIVKVERSMDRFSFNTAVAALMSLRNDLRGVIRDQTIGETTWHEVLNIMLRLMAPITPFIAEEMWSRLGLPYSIHQQPFPDYDEDIAAEDEVTLVIQINGKVRERIQVAADISEEDAKAAALGSETVQKFIEGKTPRKVIFVAQRSMINIVV
jgi:leucyl-tRNA synthetase